MAVPLADVSNLRFGRQEVEGGGERDLCRLMTPLVRRQPRIGIRNLQDIDDLNRFLGSPTQ